MFFINYDNFFNIVYFWKLEGFYDEWILFMNDNCICYINIGFGKYKLRVRVILMDDYYLLEECLFFIIVILFWWVIFWVGIFYLIIFILVGVIVLCYLWFRKDRNNLKEKIWFFINMVYDICVLLILIKVFLGEIFKNENLFE